MRYQTKAAIFNRALGLVCIIIWILFAVALVSRAYDEIKFQREVDRLTREYNKSIQSMNQTIKTMKESQ